MKIITTSSLIPRNGIDTLISACALLPKNMSWRLTIAGDGPLRGSLTKLAENLEVSKKTKFLGRIANSQIPSLLKSNDLFVRPSRFEGFGSSFLEAMAAGLPVIGTSVGGITDFITHRQTGILVLVDNPQELSESIKELSNNKTLYNKLQKNGLKLVRKNYDWDKIASSVFELMEKCR